MLSQPAPEIASQWDPDAGFDVDAHPAMSLHCHLYVLAYLCACIFLAGLGQMSAL